MNNMTDKEIKRLKGSPYEDTVGQQDSHIKEPEEKQTEHKADQSDTLKPVSKSRMARAIEFLRENLDDGIELEVEIDITPLVRVIDFIREKYKNLTK